MTSSVQAFGGFRGSDPAFLTERAFTGHKANNTSSNDLGLIYMNARYYVGSIGRFASADTLVPDQNDPQALNRYAYARNNPLLLVDESGHCWGVASFVRNWNVTVGGTTYGMGVNCNNIDMAVDIATHPDASPEDKEKAQSYLGLWGVAAFAGTVGTGGLVCSTVAPCLAAANAVLGASQSVWKLDPFRRGVEIENMLGRSPQLAQNFPVIDRFKDGVATSIKSIDLGAKSFQNLSTLNNTVRGYVNTLANWQGVESWGGVNISASSITAREVLLAVPPGASQAQINALLQLQQWASSIGVTLNVVVIP